MTTSRTEDGVRVQINRSGETGTALYGPYRKHGRNWPGFSLTGMGWVVPVLPDRNGWRGVGLYAPSELAPAPWPKLTPTLGSRRVRHRERQQTGTLLESLVFGGITWPALDRGGNLMVPVVLDDGTTRTWRASFIEPAVECEPEPGPPLELEKFRYGPRVLVSGVWTTPRSGRVLYRHGSRYPGFDTDGLWRVPVLMDYGNVTFPPATGIQPLTKPEPVEATILAEADRLANAMQTKALRDVADAAVDALEQFTSRLRAIALEGDKNAN